MALLENKKVSWWPEGENGKNIIPEDILDFRREGSVKYYVRQGPKMIGSYKILLLGPGLPLKVSGFGKLMVHFFYLPYFLLPEYLTRSPLPLQCLVFFWKLKPNERSYFISKLFSPKIFFFFLPGDILSILLINILPLESKLKKLGRCWHK